MGEVSNKQKRFLLPGGCGCSGGKFERPLFQNIPTTIAMSVTPTKVVCKVRLGGASPSMGCWFELILAMCCSCWLLRMPRWCRKIKSARFTRHNHVEKCIATGHWCVRMWHPKIYKMGKRGVEGVRYNVVAWSWPWPPN